MNFTTTQIFILITGISLLITGCGKSDPEPTEQQKVTGMLMAGGGSWSPAATGGVMLDGVDVTDDLFAGFSITFKEKTFTTTGTTPVWLRQDTWIFKDQTATVIVRGQDNREITITDISPTQLKLTLEWPKTTHSDGRQESLKGKHEFTLTK